MRAKISIVVPLFNEEENVAPLLAEIRAVGDALGQSYEAIFVNDGSQDATGRRLDEAAKGWPESRTFHFPSNHGQAAALFFGMKQAAGEILVTLDGDGQNDPVDIPRLLAALPGYDMVAGVRAGRQDSWLRLAMSQLANSVRRCLLRDGLHDTGCALKAFRREVVESFIPIRTLYSFMGAMAVAAGFRIRELEVAHRPRTRGHSKYGFSVFWWKPLIDMIGVFWFSRRRFSGRISWRPGAEK
jgi:glycosyltransferase involved in cell wall biosynthesis